MKKPEKKTQVFSFFLSSYLAISFHRFTVDEWYLSTMPHHKLNKFILSLIKCIQKGWQDNRITNRKAPNFFFWFPLKQNKMGVRKALVHNCAAIAATQAPTPLVGPVIRLPLPPDPVAPGNTSLLERSLDVCLDSVVSCSAGGIVILKRAIKFFFGGKVLHIEFRTTCPFLSASNEEGNHQFSMFTSSLVVFFCFPWNSGNWKFGTSQHQDDSFFINMFCQPGSGHVQIVAVMFLMGHKSHCVLQWCCVLCQLISPSHTNLKGSAFSHFKKVDISGWTRMGLYQLGFWT